MTELSINLIIKCNFLFQKFIMGNSSTKLAEKCSLLHKNEIHVASSFKLVSKNSEKIKQDELKKFWGSQVMKLNTFLNAVIVLILIVDGSTIQHFHNKLLVRTIEQSESSG